MLTIKLHYLAILVALIPYAVGSSHLANFPEYRSLAGLSSEEVRVVAQTFSSTPGAQPLPPPINDTSPKLVNDAAHSYMPGQPGSRGPCPGLNTLAAHGYLNRNGVVTPDQIITAVQQGFNMGYKLAAFSTYAAFIVDGNHLTNLMSIGANFSAGGQTIPGLNTHGTAEGDASTTRSDAYLGDNHNFNETLFGQLVATANLVGGGKITLESASLQKAQRIQDSIARNPTFLFGTPQYLAAYSQTTAPLAFFVSNQTADSTINVSINDARSFFQNNRYPDGFWRRQTPYDFPQVATMFKKVYSLVRVPPGYNKGAGNYVVDPQDDASTCYAYHRLVNLTARLYPNPTGVLKTAIKTNLVTFYQTVGNSSCPRLFPYGQ